MWTCCVKTVWKAAAPWWSHQKQCWRGAQGKHFKQLVYILTLQLFITCILSIFHFQNQVKSIDGKGRGVFADRAFQKDQFVVEYHGELLEIADAKARESQYAQDPTTGCYMYYFRYHDKTYWWVFWYVFIFHKTIFWCEEFESYFGYWYALMQDLR